MFEGHGVAVFQLKRIWLEIVVLLSVGAVLFWMPEIQRQGLQLFLYKVLLFSASQVHAHATRKIMFPYIAFNKSDAMDKALVIALHIAAAYLYAEGA